MWMLLLAVGLTLAALGRRKDVAVPFVPPAARREEEAVVLKFPRKRDRPGRKRQPGNQANPG